MTKRIEFPPAVKKLVAERAGLRCSVPSCGQITTGPGAQTDQTANTGMACHIYSAAEGGPRGRGGLSDEELESEKNAIWCCYTHGKLIDTNDGERFPAELLKRWRGFHEARIDRERLGLRTAQGWVDKLVLPNGWLFERGAELSFGQATLLRGDTGVGKTAIADWLAGIAGLPTLDRWQKVPPEYPTSHARLTYYSPELQIGEVEVSTSRVARLLNGVPFPRPLPDLCPSSDKLRYRTT